VHNALAAQARVFPAFDLTPLDTKSLNERDSAFAHAVYDAALRRWITLAYLIEQYTPRPFRENEPATQAALLSGAAQMVLLDKVPPHAAINESVEWIKLADRASVGGFVNAVLRKVGTLVAVVDNAGELPRRTYREGYSGRADEIPLADGQSLALRAAVLPEDPLMRLAVATSHPSSLIRHWARTIGPEKATKLALHSVCEAPTVLCTAYDTQLLPDSCSPHDLPGSHIFEGSREELSNLLSTRRNIWVQDAASSGAVARLRAHLDRDGTDTIGDGLIIDLCAGQGTKTRQLAAAFPNARIIAADPAPLRSRALATATQHLGNRVKIYALSELQQTMFQGSAAVVLLDVPCTNSGVLARRIEARYRFDEDQTERLVATQREIITAGVRLLAPDGVLCYSTCSIDQAENSGQVEWIISRGGFKPVESEVTMPLGQPGQSPLVYHDGAFSAILRRITG